MISEEMFTRAILDAYEAGYEAGLGKSGKIAKRNSIREHRKAAKYVARLVRKQNGKHRRAGY